MQASFIAQEQNCFAVSFFVSLIGMVLLQLANDLGPAGCISPNRIDWTIRSTGRRGSSKHGGNNFVCGKLSPVCVLQKCCVRHDFLQST